MNIKLDLTYRNTACLDSFAYNLEDKILIYVYDIHYQLYIRNGRERFIETCIPGNYIIRYTMDNANTLKD